jgi:hypothetical protein
LAKGIQFRDITERYAETGIRVYELSVVETTFGYLYLDPGSYSIVWEGIFDFHSVHSEAKSFIAHQTPLETKRFLGHTKPEANVFVSFILLDESRRLEEYDLQEPDQYRAYLKRLIEPDKISFARYDFLVRVSQFIFNCSLTAENPNSTPNHDRELAIKLPRPVPLSEASLKWILDRHVLGDALNKNLDLETSVAQLSRLVVSRSDPRSEDKSFAV